MRVLIGCGGTGGHIYPAVAIADGLREEVMGVEVLFVGAQGGMEMDIVARLGYTIVSVPIRGMQRKKIGQNFFLFLLFLKAFFKARSIINSFKPDIVIGTGGYACLPTLFAACSKQIPTLIQEQNSIAGLANRLLARFVTKICIGYPTVAFPGVREKLCITGNPVRASIYRPKRKQAEALRYFKLDPRKQCLLVMGGSGGASQLNRTILAGIAQLQLWGVQLLWITGMRYFKVIHAQMSLHPEWEKVRCYAFLDHMAMAYAAADIVVSRAGALSIAELCLAQKPTILVPSPNVVSDHQTKNSFPLANQGAMVWIADHLCPLFLLPTIGALLQDKKWQWALVERMYPFTCLHANAANKVVETIITLTRTGESPSLHARAIKER